MIENLCYLRCYLYRIDMLIKVETKLWQTIPVKKAGRNQEKNAKLRNLWKSKNRVPSHRAKSKTGRSRPAGKERFKEKITFN
jgi:hypothetical protein